MASMHKTEVQHHTPEQISGYLEQAEAIVDAAELDGELRVPAFLKVLDLLSSKQLFFEQVSPLGALAIPRNHQ